MTLLQNTPFIFTCGDEISLSTSNVLIKIPTVYLRHMNDGIPLVIHWMDENACSHSSAPLLLHEWLSLRTMVGEYVELQYQVEVISTLPSSVLMIDHRDIETKRTKLLQLQNDIDEMMDPLVVFN